jgi:hypothetical protein
LARGPEEFVVGMCHRLFAGKNSKQSIFVVRSSRTAEVIGKLQSRQIGKEDAVKDGVSECTVSRGLLWLRYGEDSGTHDLEHTLSEIGTRRLLKDSRSNGRTTGRAIEL